MYVKITLEEWPLEYVEAISLLDRLIYLIDKAIKEKAVTAKWR